MKMITLPRLKWLSVLLGVSLLSACGTQMVNPATGKTERLVMDERAEIAEGQKGHEQVMQEYGVYNNPAVQSYVNNLGQRLASQSHRSNLTWHFTVLDSPEINAFALPGGYVYVTRGIMAYMESEADLAGVMGHEIGHVTAKHGAQRATKQQDAGLGVFAASILGAVLESQGVSGAGQMASTISQNVAAGYIASYGREQELQADGLGAEYLSRSQYNPTNMIDVIRVLEQQEKFAQDQARLAGKDVSDAPSWLSSHPSNAQRLADIQRLATQYKKPGSSYKDDGRATYMKVIQGMNFGDSADQGLVRGQAFYHPALNFALTAPAGWRIQNSPEQLAIVSADQSAAMLLQPVPAQAGQDHNNIIKQVIQPVSGKVQALSINGMKATRFQGQRLNQQQQAVAVEATVVTHPQGKSYLLVPAGSNANAISAARGGFNAIEQSFRTLTSADRAAAQPWVIKTVPFPRGGFEQLASQSTLGAAGLGQIKLLNGYYSGGQPPVGQLVKNIVAQ